jgi:hypothetical protein
MDLSAPRKFATMATTALAILVLAMTVQLSQAPQAKAGVYGFCENVVLPGYGGCYAPASHLMYQVYGWGENASVCVVPEPYGYAERCSGGPNQGVYSADLGENKPARAAIINHAGVANRVHGLELTH